MKITGAIFDMDGTLLNSMDYWAIAPYEYLKSMGIEPSGNTSKLFLEDGLKSWYEQEKAKYGFSASLQETKAGIYSIVEQGYKTDVAVKDGAYEMLENLQAHGVKICLATATDRNTVEAVLKRLGIDKFFSKIFTCSEVGAGKREPKIYEVALEYLGTDRETTYIFEDAAYALKTAFSNNFKVVGVYDKNVYATEDEIRAMCHIYLDKDSKYRLDIE